MPIKTRKRLTSRRALIALGMIVATATCAYTQTLESLPPYQPEQKVSGIIRNFGIKMEGMVKIWEEGFRKYHPNIRFEDTLIMPSGIAGLFTGVADIGTSGREPVLTDPLPTNGGSGS